VCSGDSGVFERGARSVVAVAEDRVVHEAELARAWARCRAHVLGATTRSFPTVGSAAVEAAVDQAWTELYEGRCGSPAGLPARWKALAYLRALNGLRERRRHPISAIPVEELAEDAALVDRAVAGSEALRAEARALEIVGQLSGDARRWLEAVFDAPTAPPRQLARTLGWEPEKLKSVARRARPRLREFLSARATGVVCERRQAVMDAFAATHLERRDPVLAARLQGRQLLSSEFYEQVALHIAGCEECERAWRGAQSRLLRPRLALFPVPVAGKLAAAGGSATAAGRRLLGRLDRLFWDLRLRVGSSVGRASAGSAAGTAGTAGALAGKGAVVCAGLLCASSVGAALVALPPSIIASRTVSHHHDHKPMARHSDAAATATASTVAVSNGQTAQGDTSAARAGKNAQRAGAAQTIGKPARPVTPGSLLATSSQANTSGAASQPSARAASTGATAAASRSEVSTEYVPSAGSSSSRSSSSSAAKHGPCVPGSLSC
jgi:hypothetical protein